MGDQPGASHVVVDAPPHPQVLCCGLAPAAFDAMSRLVATAVEIDPGDQTSLDRFRLAEWDVVVTADYPVSVLPAHLNLLAMGCSRVDGLTPPEQGPIKSLSGAVTYSGDQISTQMTITSLVPPQARHLVNEVVEHLRARPTRPYLVYERFDGEAGRAVSAKGAGGVVEPWIIDADGHVIAGAHRRIGGTGICWLLPFLPPRPERWLAAALAVWHESAPDRFPQSSGWRTRAHWQTAAERAAALALEDADRERASLLEQLDARRLELDADQLTAQAAADKGLRRLLTAQGPELVDAVNQALSTLGFVVTDGDKDLKPGQPKTEDLRIADPQDPTWISLTEVKGYAKGGKTGDLQRMNRYHALHIRKTDSSPSALWYVVNQFLDQDPEVRSTLLEGADDDVEVFGELGGLVIDTRDLFRLVYMVESAAVTPQEARDWLRSQQGRFELRRA